MELPLGEFVDLSDLKWCRECQGYSTGSDRCSACHEPRLKTKAGTGYKRVRKTPPFPLMGGIHFSGRIVKVHIHGTWQIYTIWETENNGRLFYPATCSISNRDNHQIGNGVTLDGRNDFFKVMDYLGQYLANVTIQDPTWRQVDVINGEVLDTTDYALITFLEDIQDRKTPRIKDLEDHGPF